MTRLRAASDCSFIYLPSQTPLLSCALRWPKAQSSPSVGEYAKHLGRSLTSKPIKCQAKAQAVRSGSAGCWQQVEPPSEARFIRRDQSYQLQLITFTLCNCATNTLASHTHFLEKMLSGHSASFGLRANWAPGYARAHCSPTHHRRD